MTDSFQFDPVQEEVFRVEMLWEVWTMTETIHYHPRNSRANAKITLCALQWFSEGLSPLTLTELTTLYFLLSPTKTTKRLSRQDTKISALLSRLSDINTDMFSGTSQFQNFKGVEPFISMLCSGIFPIPPSRLKGKPEQSPDFGDMDSYI